LVIFCWKNTPREEDADKDPRKLPVFNLSAEVSTPREDAKPARRRVEPDPDEEESIGGSTPEDDDPF
jgi:hypothetical protein